MVPSSQKLTAISLLAAVLLGGGACAREAPAAQRPALPRPILPRPGGAFAPSLVEVESSGVKGARLADVETCGECHPDALAQWRTSAHAFASFNNPIYRFSVEAFRREVGRRQSRFCGGCHDVALLVDGAMDAEVALSDPRAMAGVTCRTCHGIASVRPDGNGSYRLTSAPIPFPRPGDPESVERHRRRVALPPLRRAALCVSCHRAFLGKQTGNRSHLAGMDDAGAWARSAYAGSRLARHDDPVPLQECRGCHMRPEAAAQGDVAAKDGRIASHRFLGGHSWLAKMRSDDAQLGRVRRFLEGVASIDVTAMLLPGGRRVLVPSDERPSPSARVLFEVVVRNRRVGHRFPGGTLDALDTWVEVDVRDARGRPLARAGAGHAASGRDRSAHVLRAELVDERGAYLRERQTHRFGAVAWNHTIGPRDAAVVRYAFSFPERAAYPLRIQARLRHRSRPLELQRAVCAATARTAGRALALDPCRAQPIVDIASVVRWVGPGARGRGLPIRPPWRRWLELGWALGHSRQEYLEDAAVVLAKALRATPAGGRGRAMVAAAAAEVASRQGLASTVRRILSGVANAPAGARIEADAWSRIWRWNLAAAPAERAARLAPGDPEAWSVLAQVQGSRGRWRKSLMAARQGLRLRPRHERLLLAQALAYRGLGAPSIVVARTLEAYLAHRRADDASRIAARCQAPGCATERVPIHVHPMVPVASTKVER